MWLITALTIALFAIGLAKGKGRRRRFNLRRVRLTPEKALATLASDTALSVAMVGSGIGSYRVVSIKGTWTIQGLTEGEGPITVGFAHSDYSVTEIKECLEASAAIDPGDKIAREQANRLVRVVGTFAGDPSSALNDGKPISTRLNWLMVPGDAPNMFIYNEFTGSLTTGASVNFAGNMWVKDSI